MKYWLKSGPLLCGESMTDVIGDETLPIGSVTLNTNNIIFISYYPMINNMYLEISSTEYATLFP